MHGGCLVASLVGDQCMVHASLSPRFVPRLSPHVNEKYCQQCEAGRGPGNEATSLPQQSKWCNHAPYRGLIELVGGGLGQIMVGKVMNQISRIEMLVFLKFNHS